MRIRIIRIAAAVIAMQFAGALVATTPSLAAGSDAQQITTATKKKQKKASSTKSKAPRATTNGSLGSGDMPGYRNDYKSGEGY
ncbi:MAG: hypothetical protein OJF62_000176 [Pseudolabrys sp.]|jgi:hypothetical protein|nr:hypothetical protein [Pseudolabrys sp.]